MREPTDILARFVRGELPPEALRKAGVVVDLAGEQAAVETGAMRPILPEITDVATGFINNRFDPEKLQRWAAVMLAASGAIDLVTLESGATGELLLEALWDAASGKPPTEKGWNAISAIT